jgi:hypothetical protein
MNWHPCQSVFFGSKGVVIKRMFVEKDGVVLQSLNAGEVLDLAADLEVSKGQFTWVWDNSGVHRVTHSVGVEPPCEAANLSNP